jgi:hypothetical protein
MNGIKNTYCLEHNYNIVNINLRRIVMWLNRPTRTLAASLLRFLDHTHTHTHTHTNTHTYTPCWTPLNQLSHRCRCGCLHKTQSQEINFHILWGFLTSDPSKRAAPFPREAVYGFKTNPCLISLI